MVGGYKYLRLLEVSWGWPPSTPDPPPHMDTSTGCRVAPFDFLCKWPEIAGHIGPVVIYLQHYNVTR